MTEHAESLRRRLAQAGVTRSIAAVEDAIESAAYNLHQRDGGNYDKIREDEAALEEGIVSHLGLPELILEPEYLEWRTKLFILEDFGGEYTPLFDDLKSIGMKHGWLDDEGMLAA